MEELDDFVVLEEKVQSIEDDINEFLPLEEEKTISLKQRLEWLINRKLTESEEIDQSFPNEPTELLNSSVILFVPESEEVKENEIESCDIIPEDLVEQIETDNIGTLEIIESEDEDERKDENESKDEINEDDDWLLLDDDVQMNHVDKRLSVSKVQVFANFFGKKEQEKKKIQVKSPEIKIEPVIRIICGDTFCTKDITKDSTCSVCYKCGKKFCKNHFKDMINVEELGWKKQLRCLLNTPDDELFDIMERDNSTICGFCEETYFQSIGQGVDHTATFVSFRNRYKKVRKSLIGSHIDKITITLQDLQREMDMNPISTSFSGLNVFKNVTWTIKATYSRCGFCDEFFEQFSSKSTCQLCRMEVCKSCGTFKIRFSTRLFPNIKQTEGVFELKVCQLCKESISHRSRRIAFLRKYAIQRGDLINDRHEQLDIHRNTIDSKIEEYSTIASWNDKSKILKGEIETEIKLYQKLSLLLEAMCAKPLKSNLNQTESRFVKGLEKSHQQYITDRTRLFRKHTVFLDNLEKKDCK